ncbi:hypothetical protein BLAT2472_90259 [Burkholderia latens]
MAIDFTPLSSQRPNTKDKALIYIYKFNHRAVASSRRGKSAALCRRVIALNRYSRFRFYATRPFSQVDE